MGRRGSDAGPTHVLVVRGLDENADEEMLRYEFSKHAPIKRQVYLCIKRICFCALLFGMFFSISFKLHNDMPIQIERFTYNMVQCYPYPAEFHDKTKPFHCCFFICCADEAALCTKCDVEVYAANKLASKHQRLQLHSLSTKLPSCDICQEKTAFIICVEDRALFCQDGDQAIQSANSLAGDHHRYLATGIRVALGSKCANEAEKKCIDPSNQNAQQIAIKSDVSQPPTITSPGWGVDDLLEFSELESANKGFRQPRSYAF